MHAACLSQLRSSTFKSVVHTLSFTRAAPGHKGSLLLTGLAADMQTANFQHQAHPDLYEPCAGAEASWAAAEDQPCCSSAKDHTQQPPAARSHCKLAACSWCSSRWPHTGWLYRLLALAVGLVMVFHAMACGAFWCYRFSGQPDVPREVRDDIRDIYILAGGVRQSLTVCSPCTGALGPRAYASVGAGMQAVLAKLFHGCTPVHRGSVCMQLLASAAYLCLLPDVLAASPFK